MKTLMVAHRGAQLVAPENTLAAFELAIRNGFKAIECDVQLTKDGKLVVLHDQTVDRTTNGTGWVSKLPYSKIANLSIETTEHIPTLKEVIDEVVLRRKCKIIIEIKADTELHAKKVSVALVHFLAKLPKKYHKYVEVHSFWYSALTLFKSSAPDFVTAAILKGGFSSQQVIDIAHQTQSNGVSLGYEFVSKKVVRECHKAHLFVDTWAVPNGTILKRLQPMSIDGIIQNFTGRKIKLQIK